MAVQGTRKLSGGQTTGQAPTSLSLYPSHLLKPLRWSPGPASRAQSQGAGEGERDSQADGCSGLSLTADSKCRTPSLCPCLRRKRKPVERRLCSTPDPGKVGLLSTPGKCGVFFPWDLQFLLELALSFPTPSPSTSLLGQPARGYRALTSSCPSDPEPKLRKTQSQGGMSPRRTGYNLGQLPGGSGPTGVTGGGKGDFHFLPP